MIKIAEEVIKKIKVDGLVQQDILNVVERPKQNGMGDLSIACFKLSAILKKKPQEIAIEICNQIQKDKHIEKCEQVGAYVNMFFSRKDMVQEAIETEGTKIQSNIGNNKTICLDYSSVNIAKPFHIGHLSSTVIGAALYRLCKRLGFNAIGINHLGDWGTQFGKLIVAVKRWSSLEEIKSKDEVFVNDLYVRFHQEAKKNPELENEARAEFKKIEDGEALANEYYRVFKEITMKAVSKIYDRLNVTFDSYNGEAFYNDKMDGVIKELKEKQLLQDSEGAKIVDLEKYGMPPCLIQKADGATLYATRDLATAIYRAKEYNFYKSFYVVAYQQNLHFKQFFKVLEVMGFEKAKDLEHIAFGMVSLADGAMSTREGRAIWLSEVLDKAVEKAKEITGNREGTKAKKDEIAEKVGVGAVVFSALWNGRIKDITFSFDKILNFEGETAPYLQYTYARCASIMRKIKNEKPKKIIEIAIDESTGELAKQIVGYKDVLLSAFEKREPSEISRYLMELASKFSRFYNENKIICDDKETQKMRVGLVYATANILKEGLEILGIPVLEEM